MKRQSFFPVLPLLLIGALIPAVVAQIGAGRGAGRGYDPKAEVSMMLTVDAVNQVQGRQGCPGGVHLLAKSKTGTFEVHVGASNFLDQQQFTFQKGEQIEVTGFKTQMQGTAVLIAREIKKDNRTLLLRDANGFPKWSGCHGQ